eukprot:6875499-Prymnesium_polylepis.1
MWRGAARRSPRLRCAPLCEYAPPGARGSGSQCAADSSADIELATLLLPPQLLALQLPPPNPPPPPKSPPPSSPSSSLPPLQQHSP